MEEDAIMGLIAEVQEQIGAAAEQTYANGYIDGGRGALTGAAAAFRLCDWPEEIKEAVAVSLEKMAGSVADGVTIAIAETHVKEAYERQD